MSENEKIIFFLPHLYVLTRLQPKAIKFVGLTKYGVRTKKCNR